MGVAATVSGLRFLAPGWRARRKPARCEPAGSGFSSPDFLRFSALVFPGRRFSHPFFCREFPQWWRRRLRAEMRFRLRGGCGFLGTLRATKLFCRARRFGLRHAQVAHGWLRHRLQIRAQTGACDFLLQFFRLFFEFARAAFEGGFFGGCALGGFRFFYPSAQPVAEAEIGQEQQADEIKRRIDNGCADRAEHPEAVVVGEISKPAARALSADIFAQLPAAGLSIMCSRPVSDSISTTPHSSDQSRRSRR